MRACVSVGYLLLSVYAATGLMSVLPERMSVMFHTLTPSVLALHKKFTNLKVADE